MAQGDFDFLIGKWNVVNRRLIEPLTGNTGWDEFPATAVCLGTLHDGQANLDEITFPTKGFAGLTLRLFDVASQEWSLYWVSSRTGVLQPPVTGRFGADGRGEFHGADEHDGRPVRVRYIWSGITADTARWEQAFATGDQGWETNWIMEFTRS